MPITFASMAVDELAADKARHRATLTAPQDAYWENGIIGASAHYVVFVDGQPGGFCAVDSDGFLVQAFVGQPSVLDLGRLFDAAMVSLGVSGAYAATNEPDFLAACREREQDSAVHTLLYFDDHTVSPMGSRRLRRATPGDLESLVAMHGAEDIVDLATMEAGFGGLAGYIRATIADGSLLVLDIDGEIAGSGDFRVRETWPGTADLGVVVAPHRRERGVGTEILCLLKQLAAEVGAEPMCSTTIENLASQRMIEKAGMAVRHQVLRVEF